MRVITLFTFILAFMQTSFAKMQPGSMVKFHETYELANIILALTDYGKSDKNEVNKNSPYYQEVLDYFDKYASHPLLSKVNYSRAQWDKLLSFRTDAVAFEFTPDGKLIRKHKFYAMGKKINEFEQNLALVEDFALKSDFRKFYASKEMYFKHLQDLYEQSLYIDQIEAFLSKEFRMTVKSSHQIIVSPLVGRMHCQRPFNEYSTSFINVPDYIFSAKNLNDIDETKIASAIHMFFTEIDHDYVNPTSAKYKKEIKKQFNPESWDRESGYQKIKQGTFNEYMTWATYDVFIRKHFPNVADQVIGEWHAINASRGFFASHLFGKQLSDIYSEKSEQETITDLYPKLLNWCGSISSRLNELTQKKR